MFVFLHKRSTNVFLFVASVFKCNLENAVIGISRCVFVDLKKSNSLFKERARPNKVMQQKWKIGLTGFGYLGRRSPFVMRGDLGSCFVLFGNPSRKHIGNIDGSLMLSSITSMMRQFHIEHRTLMSFWCYNNVSSMFSMLLHIELHRVIFNLININDSSMKRRWIINEKLMNNRWRNSYVYVFYCWILRHKTTKSSNFNSNQIEQNHSVENQKSNNWNFE